MKIVIAPDKFKGCLAAQAVAGAMARGIAEVRPDATVDLCPLADGGEGTVAAMVAATGGKLITSRVTGPLPTMQVDAQWGMLGDGVTAVIEMAAAAGLALLKPAERNPMNTTTYGVGELLMVAKEIGARKIILGIGGSATNDAGIGCAQACGARFSLKVNRMMSQGDFPLVGRDLSMIQGSVPSSFSIPILVACDVTNPLAGPKGAATVYSPQKGASPDQVQQLDLALEHLVGILHAGEMASSPGAGAAGGLGFGMMQFFGATLRSGIDIVIDAVQLAKRLQGADLCITGEGRLDSQSLSGKTPVGVARLCRQMNIPCIAIAGMADVDAAAAQREGIEKIYSLVEECGSVQVAIAQAENLLRLVMAKTIS